MMHWALMHIGHGDVVVCSLREDLAQDYLRVVVHLNILRMIDGLIRMQVQRYVHENEIKCALFDKKETDF